VNCAGCYLFAGAGLAKDEHELLSLKVSRQHELTSAFEKGGMRGDLISSEAKNPS
jgi:hypothetical protein